MISNQSRTVDRTKRLEVKDAVRYVFIEAALALAVSLLINIAVIGVFAQGFYGKTNFDMVRSMLLAILRSRTVQFTIV